MKSLKYAMAKAMIRRSVKHSDFSATLAERNVLVDRNVPDYNNSYYFALMAQDKSAVIIRLAGRGNGTFEVWFSVNLPGRGRYSIPAAFQKSVTSFEQGPLVIRCIEPERRWELAFTGDVTGEDGKSARVDFSAALASSCPIYHFTNDSNPTLMARAMAAEKWSGDFFRTLQGMHQHHYEQGGEADCSISLDGVSSSMKMKFFRDHSYGPRSWDAMDRHLWLCICLENGDYFNLGLPEYPFIKISAGFHFSGGGYASLVEAPSFAGLLGEGGPREDFTVRVKAENGGPLRCSCNRGPGFSWLMDGVYRVHEWVSDYELEGVRGVGICEFGYNVRRFEYGGF